MGIIKIEDINLDHLQTLSGMRAAIKNGESTVKELFEPVTDAIAVDDLRDLYEAKKEALSMEEQKNAERIINTPEPNSFRKLFNELSGK